MIVTVCDPSHKRSLARTTSQACNGGSQAASFKSMVGRAWPTEQAYPFRSTPGTCRLGNSTGPVVVTDYKYIVGPHAMMDALANHGPVAVAISTFPADPFTFYHEGVYSNWKCNPIIPDHVVLAVGYGTGAKHRNFPFCGFVFD